MSLDIDTSSRSEQRKFGLLMAGAFAVIGLIRFGVHWYRLGEMPGAPYVLLGIAGFFLVFGLLLPGALKPVFVAWIRLAVVMNWAVTHVVLTLAFVLLFVPISLVWRVLGKDPLNRKWEKTQESYWQEIGESSDEYDDYLNQF